MKGSSLNLMDLIPLYENPDEIWLIEFSQKLGWFVAVTGLGINPNHSYSDFYEGKAKAKNRTENLFGPALAWEEVSGDLTALIKPWIWVRKSINKVWFG